MPHCPALAKPTIVTAKKPDKLSPRVKAAD